MKYPKGAIRTEEELKKAAKCGSLFMVEWSNYEAPLRITNVRFKRAVKDDVNYKPSNKYVMIYRGDEDDDGQYWLFKGEGAVPQYDWVEDDMARGSLGEDGWCFIFTLWWHAYAYCLKMKNKS